MCSADEEFDEDESRRHLVGAALSWIVALRRRANSKAAANGTRP
jgi:hypothetical protein